MKKWDFFVIISVFCAAALIFLGYSFFGSSGKTVKISQNNKVVFEGSLLKNQTVELETNTVVIKDKTVFVSNADCKNQICVRHSPISKKGESIICLPNKVIVEIE